MFRNIFRTLLLILLFNLAQTKNKHLDPKNIILNSTNFLLIKGEINDNLASLFLHKLNKLTKKERKKQLIFIDSPGGSVESGLTIIDQIEKYKLKCYANKAFSMAFAIFQSCKIRYVSRFSQLMQHQIRFKIQDEIRKIENYFNYVKDIEKRLVEIQINKINISKTKFNKLINNEWWIFGKSCLNPILKVADKLISVDCSSKLTNENNSINIGGIREIWSRCPIITEPIEKIYNNDYIPNFFVI